MKKVYCQPYTGGNHISGYYGKPPKNQFRLDEIKLHLGKIEKNCTCGGFVYMTADEAIDIIRALSAAVHHWYLKSNHGKKVIKEKSK
ncbi:MAG: hypothetical protein KBD44_01885 [Candidatus Pacebacteria bacterium]|nr:hypothetical protein [Candidatus Paceibacterota bacterium]